MSESKRIVQYLRDPKTNALKGVAVAVSNGKSWALGISLTNFKAGDVFNKEHGLKMALGRAIKKLTVFELAQENHVKLLEELYKIRPESKDEKQLPPPPQYIAIPPSVWPQVKEFTARAKRYFKEQTEACCYTLQQSRNPKFEESVRKLQQLFETEQERVQRQSVPPSRQQEIVTMQKLSQALQAIGESEGESNKIVTRVTKP